MYLSTTELALTLKKVALHSFASAFARKVFPFPGGPKNKIPLGGDLNPVKRSGLKLGKIKHSPKVVFSYSIPAIYSNPIF